ncbi:MAG: peptidase M28, partial [Kordiimonas sp.]
MRKIFSCLVAVCGLYTPIVMAVDSGVDVATQIRDEAFNRSQVMKTLGHLTDNIGPRLTGSPQMLESNEWTKQKFTEWGLENAHLEGFEFGRGWSLNKSQVLMTSPRKVQVNALPISWLPGTDGVKEAEAIYAPVSSQKDFEKYRGKLAGKIVFLDEIRESKEPSNHVFERFDAQTLEKMKHFNVPAEEAGDAFEKKLVKVTKFSHQLDDFLEEEKVVAVVRRPSVDGMLVSGQDYQYLV